MPLNATPVTKEGSVLKKKQKNLGLSGWKKRWFVLKEGCLSYYTKKHGKFLGEFNLVAVSVNPCVVVKGKKHCFEIEAGDSTWYVSLTSEEDKDAWISAIQSCSNLSRVEDQPPPEIYEPTSGNSKRRSAYYSPSCIQNGGTQSHVPGHGLPAPENTPSRTRQALLDELVQTEEDYIDDLTTIIEVFMQPLSVKLDFLTQERLCTDQQIQSIFSNVANIKPVNQELLKRLKECQRSPLEKQNVGEIFSEVADYFKIYTSYCSNQTISISTVKQLRQNSQFDALVEEKRYHVPQCNQLDLESFLIKPIQRVCRYPLLLRELRDATDVDHPDYQQLNRALDKIDEVVGVINETKRQQENQTKILEIQTSLVFGSRKEEFKLFQPARRFVSQGNFNCIGFKREYFKGVLYLFNDIIVVGRQRGKRTLFKCVIPIQTCVLWDVPDDGKEKNKHAFSIVGGDKSKQRMHIHVTCETAIEKTRWQEEISSCIVTIPNSGLGGAVTNGVELVKRGGYS